ncbi:hypothetical protein [Paracoccus sp. (in: a-proteobacteria)]
MRQELAAKVLLAVLQGYWDQKEARKQKVGALAANREAERAALTGVGDKGDGGAAGIADVLEPERSSAAVSGLWRQSDPGQRRGRQKQAAKVLLAVLQRVFGPERSPTAASDALATGRGTGKNW